MKYKNKKSSGFTLIECVIAMVVSLVGLAGAYTLIVSSIRTEVFARDLATYNSLARAKTEEIKNTPRTSGGSLTANVNGYYDSPTAAYTRRWQISDDPMGTKTVKVTIVPNAAGTLLPQVEITTRMK